MANIAVIPARGGSKRIPRKNIKDLCGKPIIAYAIESAINSGCFSEVVVSTDDHEIAHIAKKYGASVPFIRPQEISDDFVGTNAVVSHCLDWFEKKNIVFDYVCCIYATAAFINKNIIQSGYQAISCEDYDYAATVTNYSAPIQKAMYIDDKTNTLVMREKAASETRSQDLKPFYHDAGQIYWSTPEFFRKDASVFLNRVYPIIIPEYLAQDIDTPSDWIIAEALFQTLIKDSNL